ncbi:MAG: YcxB family protein [Anaerolineales bacterium]
MLIINIYQSKEYFSRDSLYAAIIAYIIYYLIIQPYIAPYLAVVQSGKKSKETSFRKGTISSEGITYISTGNIETISWNKIYRAKQTDDLIVLFADYSPSMAFPRSFFKNESDWQQFIRWVNFYIKDR